MANREIYPSSLFPLRGDLSAEAGAVSVAVTGLQSVPVSTVAPADKQALVFDATLGVSGEWTPGVGGATQAIEVNGNGVSQDAVVLVNNNFVLAGTFLSVEVNGTRIV